MEAEKQFLKDGDIVRLYNKTLGLNLCSLPKNLAFYNLTNKAVIFQDNTNRYEKQLTVPILQFNRTEVLGLGVTSREVVPVDQSKTPSLLSTFRIVKLACNLAEFTDAENSNLKNRVVDSYLEAAKDEASNPYIARGEPVLLRSEVSGMYIGVKRFNKQVLMLSLLDNSAFEFIFVLVTRGGGNSPEETAEVGLGEQISYEDSFQIKSLLGGSLIIGPKQDSVTLEDIIYTSEEDKVEDFEQLLIEENLETSYKRHDIVDLFEPTNSFAPVNYSLRFFSVEALSKFEQELTVAFTDVFGKIVDFIFFLQEWGVVSGKSLKSTMGHIDEETDRRISDEHFYYDFEEASETHDRLNKKSNEICQALGRLCQSMLHHNYVQSFTWEDRIAYPDLALKIRQKALLDTAMFDFLFMIAKLSLLKLYQSLDFERLFGVKYDTERRKDEALDKKNKLRRLLLPPHLDWRKIRQSPQNVCKAALDKVLSCILNVVSVGVTNCPSNARDASKNADLIYYLYSFFRPVCRDILQEISKFIIVSNDNIVNWISKIETLGERRDNLDDQLTMLNMLNNFCSDFGMGKDTLSIQKRIRIQLFNIGTNPMKRGVIFFNADNEGLLLSKPTMGPMVRQAQYPSKNAESSLPPLMGESEVEIRKSHLISGDKCTVKIFKPSNMPMSKIEERIPAFKDLAFRPIDKTRFGFDMFEPRPKTRLAAENYDKVISIINEYVQLMIKMSESLNDESLNQVKNVGLTEEFCLAFLRRPDAHPKIKTSLLQLYIKLHMDAGQKVSEADLYSYSFERLNKLNLLLSTTEAFNISRGEQGLDFAEKRKTDLLQQFLRGDFTEGVEALMEQMDVTHELADDHLSFVETIIVFMLEVLDGGLTDYQLTDKVLQTVQDLLEVIQLVPIRKGKNWFSKIVAKAKFKGTHELRLLKIVDKCLDVLIVVSRLRSHLQVMAYLRQFKESYDTLKKFRCSAGFLQSLFSIYDIGAAAVDLTEERVDQSGLANLFSRKTKFKKTQNIGRVAPVVHPVNMSKATLQEQLEALSRLKYPFMDLVSQIYYKVSSKILGCNSVDLAPYVEVSSKIQLKTFKLLNSFYLQREVFSGHVGKVLLFVGNEELAVLNDFATEGRSFSQQVVTIGRLKEKVMQILLDDASMQSQLQNLPSQDSKQQRVLEFTNIVNKILSKYAERLFKPSLFEKTQDLLCILGFHEVLIEIFKVKYVEKRHSMMFSKTLKFFEYFMFRHPQNMAAMIPHCKTFVELIENRLPTARVLSSIFRFIKSLAVRQKILKAVFEKVFAIADNPDVFLPNKLRGDGYSKFEGKDMSREKLCEYFRVIRTLMLEDGKPSKKIQQLFVESLIFSFPLCKNLLPNQLELLAKSEIKQELSNHSKDSDSLLMLLREFYCLVNLAVLNNNNSLLVIASLLDQISIKTVILSEDLHPLLRVQLLRLYTEAYIFAIAKSSSSRFDKEKAATKSADVLGFINDHILVKFQYSLPFILDYGLLNGVKKDILCDFIEQLQKDRWFGFEYQTDKAAQSRKKPIHFAEKPIAFGSDFWAMMATGEVAYHSFDGILLLLMDLFSFLVAHSMHQLTAVKEILLELKTNLQNMLYAVVLIADKFPDAQLAGLLSTLHVCYRCVPISDRQFDPPVTGYRFGLSEREDVLEFFLDYRLLQDKAVLDAVRQSQREARLSEYADKQLTPDTLPDFVCACFAQFLTKRNLQIYDIYGFFDSSSFFEVCLKMRMSFSESGFTFGQAVSYVQDVVFQEETIDKDINVSRLSKKIAKLLQKGNPVGKKMALRKEKQMRLDANFEYLPEKPKAGVKGVTSLREAEEFGLNSEAIFLELKHMKSYVSDSLNSTNISGYEGLIISFFEYFNHPEVQINPFDLAAFFALEFIKINPNLESSLFRQLKFHNTVFSVTARYDEASEVQNHFALLLARLERAKIADRIFEALATCRSLAMEVEALIFLVQTVQHSSAFFEMVAAKFLREGDELFYHSKRIFNKPTLQALSDVVYRGVNRPLRIRLCEAYLEFIITFYERLQEFKGTLSIETLSRVDKVSFHLYRRLGEFVFAIRTFFKNKTDHLFVLKLYRLVARSLLSVFRVSCQALPFQEHHPFLSSLRAQFERPLSLSNNIEDEASTAVYMTCVETLNLLIDRLSKSDCRTVVGSLKLESLLKTAVLVQETRLADAADKLGKNLICDNCTINCTFYRCVNKKVTVFEKRLADIGYQLFVFLEKTRLMFPDIVAADFGVSEEDGRTYKTHLDKIENILEKQITKFDGFGKQFQRQMEAQYGKASRPSRKRSASAKRKASKIQALPVSEDFGHSSLLPLPGRKALDGSAGELSKNEAKEDQDNDRLSISEHQKPVPAGLQAVRRRSIKIKTGDGGLGDGEAGGYSRIEGEEDHHSLRSIESLRYVLTVEVPHSDSIKLVEAQEQDHGDEFTVRDLVDKFTQGVRNNTQTTSETQAVHDAHIKPLLHSNTGGTKSKVLVDKVRNIFKKEEAATIDREHELYVQKLSAYKVAKALQFYEENVKTIRLSYATVLAKDEQFQITQNTLYYVSPHILKYYSKKVEDDIIGKLLEYPPRTRKVVFLKEMNLYMGNLVEYQKLYAFKELSWIVWVAELTKIINIMFIVFINIYVLFTINLSNSDTAVERPFLYTIMIISCTVSGICAVFTPIQKLFLANTYASRFYSYKNRIDEDYQEGISQNQINEDKKSYFRLYGYYVELLALLHRIVNQRWGKIVMSLFHIDNLVQFSIFFLSIIGITSLDLTGTYISLFLILIKTSAVYKLYLYLSANVVSMTVFLIFLLILFFQVGVMYFTAFSGTLNYEEGVNCEGILECTAFAASYGLLGNFGSTEDVRTPSISSDDSSMYYFREFSDTVMYLIFSLLTSVLILALILLQLSGKRQEMSQLKDKISKECLVCGVGKDYMEQRGIKWKEHIYEEHNFRKMVHFIIYLLDKPETHCTAFESKLKDKIVSCDAGFFEELRIDRQISRMPTAGEPIKEISGSPN